KAEVAPEAEAEDYSKMAAGLHTLREDIKAYFHKSDEEATPEEHEGTIDEFHDRVDEHLEWMRKSGREW
ncbi:MAG: hypothetical protein JSW25_04820, partial [Thermoplasmata archaeon]